MPKKPKKFFTKMKKGKKGHWTGHTKILLLLYCNNLLKCKAWLAFFSENGFEDDVTLNVKSRFASEKQLFLVQDYSW